MRDPLWNRRIQPRQMSKLSLSELVAYGRYLARLAAKNDAWDDELHEARTEWKRQKSERLKRK